jgi:hypothetical protein
MQQFSTSPENQAQHKAACLSCGLWAMLQEPRICDSCHSDLLGEVQSAAINFGDDVNTAPTLSAVPVGNTGTTSTGHFLTLAPVMSFQAMHLQKLRVMQQVCVRRYGKKHAHSLSLEASLRLEASYLLTTEPFYFWDKP